MTNNFNLRFEMQRIKSNILFLSQFKRTGNDFYPRINSIVYGQGTMNNLHGMVIIHTYVLYAVFSLPKLHVPWLTTKYSWRKANKGETLAKTAWSNNHSRLCTRWQCWHVQFFNTQANAATMNLFYTVVFAKFLCLIAAHFSGFVHFPNHLEYVFSVKF